MAKIVAILKQNVRLHQRRASHSLWLRGCTWCWNGDLQEIPTQEVTLREMSAGLNYVSPLLSLWYSLVLNAIDWPGWKYDLHNFCWLFWCFDASLWFLEETLRCSHQTNFNNHSQGVKLPHAALIISQSSHTVSSTNVSAHLVLSSIFSSRLPFPFNPWLLMNYLPRLK